ncbi:unnamed protein product, partial [Symbiodinium microadriaticum]
MAKLIEENITRPLGLKQTVYCDTPQIPRPVLHAFTTERGKYEESTFWNPSWTSHSGLMISTLGDMGTLAAAIGAGKLLKKETRAEMTAPTTVGLGINQENLYYAMGIGVMDDWLVQNPRFGGYTVLFANLPEEDLTVIVANTLGPKASPDIAYATLIFKEIVKRLTPQHLIPEIEIVAAMGGMPYLDAERELVVCFWFAREGGDAMKSKPVVIGLVGLVVVGAASALAFGWLTSPLGGNQEVTIGPHTVVSHPTKKVVPATDVLDEATVQPSPEFLVEYAFGSGTDGFDILKVHADGSAEFQYWDSSGERTVQKTTQFQ